MKSSIRKSINVNITKSKEYRNELERKAREVMSRNPGITLKDLAKEVGCTYGVLSHAYNKIRKEMSAKGTV